MTPLLPFDAWQVVRRCDPIARELADRHYPRQRRGRVGYREFLPPSRNVVLVRVNAGGRAVWALTFNRPPGSPLYQFRCAIFRNEGAGLSSSLIEEATALSRAEWRRKYGALPAEPLRTEVDAREVRRKRDPGRCFRRAGWRVVDVARAAARGLVVLEAPT